MLEKTKINLLNLDKQNIKKLNSLNPFALKILEKITEKWPTNPLEIANELGENGNIKSLSSRYLYHFKKLKKMGLIDMKRLGNTYVAWPIDVEKIRLLHEMVREGD